jgi:hypothetical protein
MQLAFHTDAELTRRFKAKCRDQNRTYRDVFTELMAAWLEQ